MIDPFANFLDLTIPAGAQPGTARITIGARLPADLVAFYAGQPMAGTTVGGLVMFQGGVGDDYDYLILVTYVGTNSPRLCAGTRNSFGVVETYAVAPSNVFGTQFFIPGYKAPGAVHGVVTTAAWTWLNATSINVAGTPLFIDNSSAFSIDGISQPRGLRTRIDSIAGTGAIGAETVTLTTAGVALTQGRAYLIRMRAQQAWTAAATLTIRVRLTNIAGTVWAAGTVVTAAAGQTPFYDEFVVVKTSATSTEVLVQTLTASAGTMSHNAAGNAVRYLEVWDVGVVAAYPNAFAV